MSSEMIVFIMNADSNQAGTNLADSHAREQ
jgi:hypothetical protein